MDDAHPGRRSAIAAAACFAGVAVIALAWFVFPSDETRIRRAIPGAAAMPPAMRRQIGGNPTGAVCPRWQSLSVFEDQTLTALVVLGPPIGEGDVMIAEDIGPIGLPNPADIADELGRRSPVTIISEPDITRFTCEVDGGRAHGVVEFEAEGLWRGRVEYRAEKRIGVWTITEFRLPTSRAGVRLDANGRWRFYRDPEQ